MLCQKCHERPATVHLTQVINLAKTELHLCEVCAKESGGELGFLFEPNFTFQNLITGFLEGETNYYPEQPTEQDVSCQKCGLTFSDFRRVGLLGCGECYRYFKQGLDPLLKRVQGATHHIGKAPKRTGGKIRVKQEIDNLRLQLQQDIAREDYEHAAKLRDEIRRREHEIEE